ncbi:2Fe-2S iron-sulfur cluster-binding protein [Bacillus marinisedimentorum]|uniref:2Fe-2S iron-sulfur cluster-binding protein n=1 Tax=Bacillus marinisedimentorum TaxID=1821260 RepID=UPI0009F1DE94|nr:2Fe-2S iron-sulfur cluster-binding protein [Bacillus marinisedimentorum]
MTKRLTIGSLKQGSKPSFERKTFSSSPEKKPLEIEQHRSHYQVMPVRNKTVLDSALDQNMKLDYKCKKGTCGKCQVKVLNGKDLITSVNDAEQKKLGTLSRNGYRLACQAVFK